MGLFKWCCTCGLLRPISDFNRRTTAPDGLQARCRECSRRWYEENREQHIANTGRRSIQVRRANSRGIIAYLVDHPCVDCGETDIRCLDLDHRDPSTKTDSIANMVHRGSRWKDILREIGKCDVRCANCHRRRTAEQVDSQRHRYLLAAEPPTAPLTSPTAPAGSP